LEGIIKVIEDLFFIYIFFVNSVIKMTLYKPIEESVELDVNYPTVSERYYTHYYHIPKQKESKCHNEAYMTSEEVEAKLSSAQPLDSKELSRNGEDTCVMMHSNRLCLIGLSDKHPIITKSKTIAKVNFELGPNCNRLENTVSGKGKRGAQILGKISAVCEVQCTDGSSYIVQAGVRGKLVEINDRLLSNPQLAATHAQSEGFLAVILPKLHEAEYAVKTLMSREQYNQFHENDQPAEAQ